MTVSVLNTRDEAEVDEHLAELPFSAALISRVPATASLVTRKSVLRLIRAAKASPRRLA